MRLWRLTSARMFFDRWQSWNHYGMAIRQHGDSCHWGKGRYGQSYFHYDEVTHVWQLIPGLIVIFNFKRPPQKQETPHD